MGPAYRGVIVSHESVQQWALKLGQDFANRIRRRCPAAADRGGSAALDELRVTLSRAARYRQAYATAGASRLANQN